MTTTYLPIDPDFIELFKKEIEKDSTRVIYFGKETSLEEVNGKAEALITKNNFEYYIKYFSGKEVRVDRIITYNGKPGPAFDEYDAYALACLSCKAGYDE